MISDRYRTMIDLLRCPECRAQLHLELFDQEAGRPLEGLLSCSCGLWYPLTNGIPRLFVPGPLRPADNAFCAKWQQRLTPAIRPLSVTVEADLDNQVQNTFGHKWTKQNWWGIEGETAQFMEQWLLPRYGWQDKAGYHHYFSARHICVDAGCGLGREAMRMATANPNAVVIGLELSECIDEAYKHALNKGLNNIFFIQADLNRPPLATGAVDFIISEGVLHHTPNTYQAFNSLVPLLKTDGEFGFYVYRQKAALREYADDYIREQLTHLQPEQAWEALESLTKLGKTLSNLNVNVTVEEDVPLLGIKAGEYDLQRLIYYNIFKCFWNPQFTFDENVHINYDWYTPRFAWRHTETEIREWLQEACLSLVHEHIEDAGITVRGKKW